LSMEHIVMLMLMLNNAERNQLKTFYIHAAIVPIAQIADTRQCQSINTCRYDENKHVLGASISHTVSLTFVDT
jgi:hypothetical protein